MAKVNISHTKNGTKEKRSVALSGDAIDAMLKTSQESNISVSAIAEFAIRKLYNLPMDLFPQKLFTLFP